MVSSVFQYVLLHSYKLLLLLRLVAFISVTQLGNNTSSILSRRAIPIEIEIQLDFFLLICVVLALAADFDKQTPWCRREKRLHFGTISPHYIYSALSLVKGRGQQFNTNEEFDEVLFISYVAICLRHGFPIHCLGNMASCFFLILSLIFLYFRTIGRF